MELRNIEFSRVLLTSQFEVYNVRRDYVGKASQFDLLTFYDHRAKDADGLNLITVFYFSIDKDDEALEKIDEFAECMFGIKRNCNWEFKIYQVKPSDLEYGDDDREEEESDVCIILQRCFNVSDVELNVPLIKNTEFKYLVQSDSVHSSI
ncbi:MAG: hypothetical protein ACE3JK_01575 [Sporolactobacillus sp.]